MISTNPESLSPDKFVCATRGSKLALAQFEELRKELLKTSIEVEPLIIKTYGDKHQEQSLKEIGGQGVFIKDVQKAVIDGRADFALHSAKDCPVQLPDSTQIAAIFGREHVEDVVIGLPLEESKVIGTSSQRREAQLLLFDDNKNISNSNFKVKDIRGNIETRISKVGNEYNSIILAKAGLVRLELHDLITQELSVQKMVPQVGQGGLIVECSKNFKHIEKLKEINNEENYLCISQEREFLNVLGQGCTSPVGLNVSINGDQIHTVAFFKNKKYFFEFDDIDNVGKIVATKVMEDQS